MKILHTSDWHIGHKLYGNDRTDEHLLFFDWLIQTINSHKIDVLLVCGDIFDVGYPSNLALKSYYRFLKNLIGTHCQKVIITGGNHDFISTLEAPREILELLNVVVMGGAPENQEDEIIELQNAQNDVEAIIGAVPFLRDKDIRTPVAGESTDDRIKATREGIVKHYHDLAGLTTKYNHQNIPIIVTGHLYMQGSQLSESERDIQLGNQAGVAASAFPAIFDYYALGHIHRPQTISEKPYVIYSGSPIALSFSEQNHTKSLRLIEIKDGRLTHEKIEIPKFRKIKSFSGTFSDISKQIKDYDSDSPLPDWLEINIEEPKHDSLMARAAAEYVENTNAQRTNFTIIRHTLTFANRNISAYLFDENGKSLSDLKETQVFDKLLQKHGITERDDLKQSFDELLQLLHSFEN